MPKVFSGSEMNLSWVRLGGSWRGGGALGVRIYVCIRARGNWKSLVKYVSVAATTSDQNKLIMIIIILPRPAAVAVTRCSVVLLLLQVCTKGKYVILVYDNISAKNDCWRGRRICLFSGRPAYPCRPARYTEVGRHNV